MTTEKIVLICDESGAKGKSTNRESFPGEIGIFAGFMILEKNIDVVTRDLEAISLPFKQSGKIHLADLSENDQHKIRNEIFSYLLENRIPCLFEAVHVEGYYEATLHLKELELRGRNIVPDHISISRHEAFEVLHNDLFLGVFTKALAICMDCLETEYFIKVITDRIDKKVVKGFKKRVDELLSDSPIQISSKGYDTIAKRVVERKARIDFDIPDKYKIPIEFKGYEIEIDAKNGALTIAADVIANSLHNHFRKRNLDDIGGDLHSNDECNHDNCG